MDRLDLYYGDNLNLDNGIVIKHPTLLKIKEIGYDTYSEYIYMLTLKPEDVADILWFDRQKWYEDLSMWQFIIEMYMSDDIMKNALKWFTGYEFVVMQDTTDNRIYLYNKETTKSINEFTYMQIVYFLKTINFIPEKNILDSMGNRRGKEFILKEKYRKRKEKQQELNIDLASIVSSLDWKCCKGNDIFDFPIYRIHEGYYRLCQIDNYDKTMMGLYFGSIDTKKNPIDWEKINWSNVIKI